MYRDKAKIDKILARIEKDPKAVARELYDYMSENKDLRQECRNKNIAHVEENILPFPIAKVNENLADILKQNGIHPTKYIVQYRTRICDECAFRDSYECWSGEDNICNFDEVIVNIPFYGFEIDKWGFYAIKGNFERLEIEKEDLLCVMREDGKVIYKAK